MEHSKDFWTDHVMNGLIELIFERVPDGALNKLVSDLLQGAGILELSHSELGCIETNNTCRDLLLLLNKSLEPSSIFIRSAYVSIGDVEICCPLIRILRFEGLNEVAVIFAGTDIITTDSEDSVEKLAASATVLANNANVIDFYCGFEPAADEQTRLFSRNKIGPIVKL